MHLDDRESDKESRHLTEFAMRIKELGRGGFEPPTHGFSVLMSIKKFRPSDKQSEGPFLRSMGAILCQECVNRHYITICY
jgi:hypothetical protein